MGERNRHLDLVRERFTRTAQPFARFALTTRAEEAERLAALAVEDLPAAARSTALDLACGPGTFTRAFAARVGFLCALDLTPAMLEQARQAAARAQLRNIAFACADANALPLADAAVALAVCGYAFHHFLEPGRPVRELARVLRPGGRVAVADLVVPEGADAELNNRIERARDSSHARTLTAAELAALLEAGGFRIRAVQTHERQREFDDWMRIIAAPPGSHVYRETRRLMESSIAGDPAGYRPRAVPGSAKLEFVQTTFFVVAEKR